MTGKFSLKDVPARAPHLGLGIIVAVFLLLAVLHSLIVPITQGEDELAHYRYISFISQTGRLPLDDVEREQAWYRSDWPPLYHLLVGWVTAPIDTARPVLKDVGEAPHRRLVGEIFYPRLIVYTEDVSWPWQDGILVWHLGRFMSILFSAGALVFTYLTVIEMCGAVTGKPPQRLCAPTPLLSLATLTTALLAFTPRYVFTSAMLGDDSLFILLSAIFIWLLLRALRGADGRWVYGAMGLLLGLSVATKYSTGLLPLVLIPVVWWRAGRAGWTWRSALGRVVVGWLGTLVGAGWWFGWIGYHFNTVKEDGLFFGLLRPLLAAGPDVSMRRIFALFAGAGFSGRERPDAIEPGTLWDWLVYMFQTFWGVPVLERDPMFPWAYIAMLICCLLALFGLWRLWQEADSLTRMTMIVLALIIGLLIPFPLLRFFLTHNVLETGQGRHLLYPAAQAIPILFMLGWMSALAFIDCNYAPRPAFHPLRFTCLLPILLLLWSIFQLIHMTRTYPNPLPIRTTTFRAETIPQPLKHDFSADLQLLGYDFAPDPEQAIINLTLFWRSIKPVSENYRAQVQLVDPAGQPHFTWLSHPLNGRYPTRAWDAGDVIRDTLPLPLAAMPPNIYTIRLDLLHEADDTPLAGEPFTIAQFELPTRQPIPNASAIGDIDYRLWLAADPAHHRQTIPLSWFDDGSQPVARADAGDEGVSQASDLTWALLGPDKAPRFPAATGDATAIFIVGPDWPSGDYRLQLQDGAESHQTGSVLTVANDLRRFELPPDLTGQPGWTPVEATFGDLAGQPQVKLIGYVLPTRRTEPGEGFPLTLYWQSLAPVLGDYIVFDVLLDENQQVFGGYDRLPREYYSTILWASDEVVEDGFAVPVSPEASPGVYQLHLGLYTLATSVPVSLPLLQDGHPIDATSVIIGPIKVGGPPAGITTDNPNPFIILNQPFGHQVTLLGYDLTDAEGRLITNYQLPITNLRLTLYWRVEAPLEADYTTFFHLRSEANETVAQMDRPPANGRYPTSLWDPVEVIIDEITLPVDQVPPGQYTPVIGLYDRAADTRLPIEGIPENELRLESVTLP
jgi:4-amino-4-deoxy-L-arabinose transferase-like glycosyltransferase